MVAMYAFNTEENAFSFPPEGFTLRWFAAAAARDDVVAAIILSAKVAAVATLGALVLGTLAALAVARRTFRGRDLVTLTFVVPIALPGIITGIALHSVFRLGDIPHGFWTIAIGHTTFCVVVVYNNAAARLRRLPPSLLEASLDLGADGFTAFRTVVLPQLATVAAGRRHPRLRPLLRRAHRHHLHRRPREDPADLAAQPARPPARGAGHQRRRPGRDGHDRPADPGRLVAHPRHRGRRAAPAGERRLQLLQRSCWRMAYEADLYRPASVGKLKTVRRK